MSASIFIAPTGYQARSIGRSSQDQRLSLTCPGIMARLSSCQNPSDEEAA